MYGAIKIRNQIEKANANAKYGHRLLFKIKNTRVNGIQYGFSGHVLDVDTGVCVYTAYDVSVFGNLKGKGLYRLAKDTWDFSSNGIPNGHNRFENIDHLAEAIVDLIHQENMARRA